MDPSIKMRLTCGPKVCKHDLDWAIWIPRVMLDADGCDILSSFKSQRTLVLGSPLAYVLSESCSRKSRLYIPPPQIRSFNFRKIPSPSGLCDCHARSVVEILESAQASSS